MKQFVKFVVLRCILPILLICVLISSVALRKYPISEVQLEKAYNDQIDEYKWVTILDHADGYILGSSSLRYGLSSTVLGNSEKNWVNLSMDARDPIVFYLLLKKYAPIKKPATVLVGLDPWIFAKKYYRYRTQLMFLDYDRKESFNYFFENKSFLVSKTIYYLKEKCGLNAPSQGERFDIGIKIPDDLGSVKLTHAAVNFKEVNDDWFEISKYDWSDIEFEHLRMIKDYCNQNHINLIFVIPPKREDYIAIAETKFLDIHKEWWKKINECIGGEKIIGHCADMSQFNQDSAFVEAYHLSAYGQKAYSVYLRSKIDSPRIITAQMDLFH